MKLDLESISVVNIEPGDVIVLQHRQRLTSLALEHIGKAMRRVFPDNEFMILEDGVTMDVYRPALTTEPVTRITCYRCRHVFDIEPCKSLDQNLCPQCAAAKETCHAQGT